MVQQRQAVSCRRRQSAENCLVREQSSLLRGVLILVAAVSCTHVTPPPAVWSPNVDAETYRNPIIFADYSDPDVVRVGDDFYMTASSFTSFPGLPILHSRDL